MDAINQAGQHAALYGERGVGKTSLANTFVDLWNGSGVVIAPRVTCLSDDTYDTVWRRALDEIGTTRASRRAGFRRQSERKATTVLELIEDGPISADVVRKVLTYVGKAVILVLFFDEFDSLSAEVRKKMAETVKMLSDYEVPGTLVFVGVADSVTDLIHDHASIERALVQVQMPRMHVAELRQIVEKGLAKLEMDISPHALSRITDLSLGLPHYTHLLALHAARESLDRGLLRIDQRSVDLAIGKALNGTQQSLVDRYNNAVASSQRNSLYRQVLTACALAAGNTGEYFAPAAVREPLSKIMGRTYDVPSYVRHLRDFSEAKRGTILQRTGSARNHRFRFANPLMQPYVLMRAKHEGLLVFDMEQI